LALFVSVWPVWPVCGCLARFTRYAVPYIFFLRLRLVTVSPGTLYLYIFIGLPVNFVPCHYKISVARLVFIWEMAVTQADKDICNV
jgi:hypothetical protein